VSANKLWPVEKIGKTWVEEELGAPETESPAIPRRRRRRTSMILVYIM
jgi:hypothetical protein